MPADTVSRHTLQHASGLPDAAGRELQTASMHVDATHAAHPPQASRSLCVPGDTQPRAMAMAVDGAVHRDRGPSAWEQGIEILQQLPQRDQPWLVAQQPAQLRHKACTQVCLEIAVVWQTQRSTSHAHNSGIACDTLLTESSWTTHEQRDHPECPRQLQGTTTNGTSPGNGPAGTNLAGRTRPSPAASLPSQTTGFSKLAELHFTLALPSSPPC